MYYNLIKTTQFLIKPNCLSHRFIKFRYLMCRLNLFRKQLRKLTNLEMLSQLHGMFLCLLLSMQKTSRGEKIQRKRQGIQASTVFSKQGVKSGLSVFHVTLTFCNKRSALYTVTQMRKDLRKRVIYQVFVIEVQDSRLTS